MEWDSYDDPREVAPPAGETARLITVDRMLFEAYKQDSILLDSVEDDGLTLRKALAQAKAAREGLAALVAQWQREAAVKDTFHATMGMGWKVCAAELAAWLAQEPGEKKGQP